MKKKIILSLILTIFTTIIFNLQNVFGVGIVSHSWVTDVDGDGKNDLIYRTYTTPDESLVSDYMRTNSTDYVTDGNRQWEYIDTNNKRQKAKWIVTYKEGVDTLPSHGTYVSIGIKFHTEMLSSYAPTETNAYMYGYNNAGNVPLEANIVTLQTAVKKSSKTKVTSANEKNNYDSKIFYEVMAFNAKISKVDWGSGLRVTGLSLKKSVEYRYTIVEVDGTNVYVSDTVVYNPQLVEMIKKAKEKGNTDECYVSNVIISKSYYDGNGYEAAYTVHDFFHQFGKYKEENGTLTTTWSNKTRGKATGTDANNKAMGAVLNLLDNKIIFPQLATKTVLVKHINLGGTTSVSAQNVKNAEPITSNTINLTAYSQNTEKRVIGSSTGSVSGYQEYYEDMLEPEHGINKLALADTDNYRCIGYNVATDTSQAKAQQYIDNRVKSGLYIARSGTANVQVNVQPNTSANNDEVVIIEFYYATPKEDVYVNHISVDSSGQVRDIERQQIEPNKTAKVGNTVINRTNTDIYIKEVYNHFLGTNITVTNNANVPNYVGYQLFKKEKPIEELIGTNINLNNLNKATTATISSTQNVQVNFYYKIDQIDQYKPQIDGKVFVNPTTTTISTSCPDGEGGNTSVVSIPSDSYAKVGVTGIPRSMIAAITDLYSLQRTEITINAKVKLGNQTKTVTKTITSSANYYKITDLAVYELNNVKVYDAGYGHNGTVGTKIFNWQDGIKTLTPYTDRTTISMAIAGNNIAASDVNNVTKYVNIKGSYTTLSGESKSFTINPDSNEYSKTYTLEEYEYLTQEQLDTVDANKDGKVTTADKTKVDTDYNNWKNQAEQLIKLKNAWDDAIAKRDAKLKALAITDISELNAKISNENKSLESLKGEKAELTSKKNTLDQNISSKEKANGQLVGDIGQLESEIAYLKEYISCNDLSQDTTDEFLKKCITLKEVIEDTCGIYNVEDAQELIDQLNRYIADKKQEIEDNNTKISSWEKERTTIETNIKKKEQSISLKENEIANLKTQKNDLQALIDAVTDAKNAYNNLKNNINSDYQNYYDTFNANYEKYKSKYDEYANLSANTLGGKIGLKLEVTAKNMDVKLNGTSILKYGASGGSTITKTHNITTQTNVNTKTTEPTIDNKLYKNLQSTVITESDYNNSNKINESITNGTRIFAGEANYTARTVLKTTANSLKDIVDTVYYKQNDAEFILKTTSLKKYYKSNANATTVENKYKEVDLVNIYTPITVKAVLKTLDNSGTIEANTPFTIKLSNKIQHNKYTSLLDTYTYNKGFFVKFGFDVEKVKLNGKEYNNGKKVNAGTWIGLIPGNSLGEAEIVAEPYGEIRENTYVVRAVADNVTELILNKSTRYERLEDMKNGDIKDLVENICDTTSYFAETEGEVQIANRIYDFKITDLKDINWKTVFRKNTSNTTGEHTSNVYYSGIKKWDVESNAENGITNRTTKEIGKNPFKILPLGPYKNTDTTYIKAPKLGYRFSYDLKVSGAYYDEARNPLTDKIVNIKTKFYYISKDGKTYLPEYTGSGTGIYLFYKNSSGKYVRIDGNGGGYTLKFTPNDGYRFVVDNDMSTLTKESVSLGNIRNIILKYNMATTIDSGLSTTYYGEYKLPNSTIAVQVNSGKYDINKPLTDGYIGVVFDITTTDESGVVSSYSKNRSGTNTSQWAYEGFLGYDKLGQEVKDNSLYLRLEKGTWNITQAIYENIKGTVILYDIDQRAATDYE